MDRKITAQLKQIGYFASHLIFLIVFRRLAVGMSEQLLVRLPKYFLVSQRERERRREGRDRQTEKGRQRERDRET